MLLLCLLLFAVVAYFYVKQLLYLRIVNKFPGPKTLPFLGNFLEIKDRSKGFENAHRHTNLYGKTYRLVAFMEPVVVTSDCHLIELLFGQTTLTNKSKHYSFFERWFGDGLLISKGQKWKTRRRILTPAFHYNVLEDFVGVFEDKGKLLVKNLQEHVDGDSFDIFKKFTLYTLDVICETAMGTCVNAQENPNHEYTRCVKRMCDIISMRTLYPLYNLDFLYKLSPMYREELQVVKVLNDFSTGIIRKRREYLRSRGGNGDSKTFMDILLNSESDGVPLSDGDVKEEVDTFLFEGHDTTAIALSFIAYNLAEHPNVQQKAFQEVKELLRPDKTKTIPVLNSMKYLEMVIKESLRLYPPVVIHARNVTEDIHYDGKVIPEGCTVLINQMILHSLEDAFPGPSVFDPERFDPDLKNRRHPYAYIPFSAGPRNCIGQKFAMLELKSAISEILMRFELLPAEPKFVPKTESIVTLTAVNGVHLKLKKRIIESPN